MTTSNKLTNWAIDFEVSLVPCSKWIYVRGLRSEIQQCTSVIGIHSSIPNFPTWINTSQLEWKLAIMELPGLVVSNYTFGKQVRTVLGMADTRIVPFLGVLRRPKLGLLKRPVTVMPKKCWRVKIETRVWFCRMYNF